MAINSKEKQREYDKKRRGKRSRNFNVIFYPEDLPQSWQHELDETRIRWIEGPLHDKDVYTAEDEEENAEHKAGQLKKAHKHCLLMFENLKTVDFVTGLLGSIFGTSETGSVVGVLSPQICNDRSGSVRYMAHMDNPTKAQYNFDDIVGHNGADPLDIVKFNVRESLNKMIEIEEYIEEHDIRELCDLSKQLRVVRLDLYQILATRSTVYFNAFIRSYRNKMEKWDAIQKALADGSAYVDEETGEIVFRSEKVGGGRNGR